MQELVPVVAAGICVLLSIPIAKILKLNAWVLAGVAVCALAAAFLLPLLFRAAGTMQDAILYSVLLAVVLIAVLSVASIFITRVLKRRWPERFAAGEAMEPEEALSDAAPAGGRVKETRRRSPRRVRAKKGEVAPALAAAGIGADAAVPYVETIFDEPMPVQAPAGGGTAFEREDDMADHGGLRYAQLRDKILAADDTGPGDAGLLMPDTDGSEELFDELLDELIEEEISREEAAALLAETGSVAPAAQPAMTGGAESQAAQRPAIPVEQARPATVKPAREPVRPAPAASSGEVRQKPAPTPVQSAPAASSEKVPQQQEGSRAAVPGTENDMQMLAAFMSKVISTKPTAADDALAGEEQESMMTDKETKAMEDEITSELISDMAGEESAVQPAVSAEPSAPRDVAGYRAEPVDIEDEITAEIIADLAAKAAQWGLKEVNAEGGMATPAAVRVAAPPVGQVAAKPDIDRVLLTTEQELTEELHALYAAPPADVDDELPTEVLMQMDDIMDEIFEENGQAADEVDALALSLEDQILAELMEELAEPQMPDLSAQIMDEADAAPATQEAPDLMSVLDGAYGAMGAGNWSEAAQQFKLALTLTGDAHFIQRIQLELLNMLMREGSRMEAVDLVFEILGAGYKLNEVETATVYDVLEELQKGV